MHIAQSPLRHRGTVARCVEGNRIVCKSSLPRERAPVITPPGTRAAAASGLYKSLKSLFREHGRSSTFQVYLAVYLTTMKAVALILALAVITGCNARAVPQADVPQNRWEDMVDRFWEHVSQLNQKADGVVDDLKASQLRRDLDTLITDSMTELSTYRDDIQTKLSPYADLSSGQLSQDMQLLANKLHQDMLDAKERSIVYLDELKAMMGQNSDNVRSHINTYSNKLRKRLDKDTEEIRNTVATYLGEVQSRTSQNLEAVKEHVEPYVQQASDSATKKLSDLSSMLKSQAEGLSHQLETQAEGIKTQLESTAQDLRTSLEGKIDELTELLSPIATKFREQIEKIMEKVKETTSA
nr:apolipoprotein Eb-like [Monopterus albus]